MLAPSFIIVALLFLAPVVLTGVFSFTTMTTGTGISGGAYQIDEATIAALREQGFPADVLDRLGTESFTVDDTTLAAAREAGVPEALISELAASHRGGVFATRVDFERFLKTQSARPATTRDLKAASAPFRRSIVNIRYDSREAFLAAIDGLGLGLDAAARAKIEDAAYTGWHWTTANYSRMLSSAESFWRLVRTVLYVGATVALFNVGFALVLAVTTFYLPARTAAIVRAAWLLPRILPPVLYVLLWKWLAWDNGFISTVLAPFGVPSRNWLLDNGVNAWIFVILINGFVGASMGMIIFASAIRAIPVTLFYASATRWRLDPAAGPPRDLAATEMADPVRDLLPDALSARLVRIHPALDERAARHDDGGLGVGRLPHGAQQLYGQPRIRARRGARHRARGDRPHRIDRLSAAVQLRGARAAAPHRAVRPTMESKSRTIVIAALLGLASLPLLVMLISLVVDTVTTSPPGSLLPNHFTLDAWRFLWSDLPGRPNIWIATVNTIVFAGSSALLLLAVSSTAGYALARLNVPFRKFFLAGVTRHARLPGGDPHHRDLPDPSDRRALQPHRRRDPGQDRARLAAWASGS